MTTTAFATIDELRAFLTARLDTRADVSLLPLPAVTCTAIADAVAAAHWGADFTLDTPAALAADRAVIIYDTFRTLRSAGVALASHPAAIEALGGDDYHHGLTLSHWVIADVAESLDPAYPCLPLGSSWTGTIPGIGRVRCTITSGARCHVTIEARLLDEAIAAEARAAIADELDQLTADDSLRTSSIERCIAAMADAVADPGVPLDVPDTIAALSVAIERVANPGQPDDWAFAGYAAGLGEDYTPPGAAYALADALVPLVELLPDYYEVLS